jgi:hypothetical protein
MRVLAVLTAACLPSQRAHTRHLAPAPANAAPPPPHTHTRARAQVTEADVRTAYRLWYDALSGSASDEEGRLDMSLLTGGASAKQQAFLGQELPALLRRMLDGGWVRWCGGAACTAASVTGCLRRASNPCATHQRRAGRPRLALWHATTQHHARDQPRARTRTRTRASTHTHPQTCSRRARV